jgi:hypothetical protein
MTKPNEFRQRRKTGGRMIDNIVRRAKTQARQPIILSENESLNLRHAVAVIQTVADDCRDEHLAFSLNHMLDRLHRIIAAGDYRRRRSSDPTLHDAPYAEAAERLRQQEIARLRGELDPDLP